ncbi:hypothetical protein Aperf_G00000064757 [Anoplocephala perfoliata]
MNKSADTDEVLQEAEYNEMEQQCRKVEREKKRYMDRLRVLFYKYEKEMNLLEAENEDLKLQISIADCINCCKEDGKLFEGLREMEIHYDQLQQNIKKEREKQLDLDCETYNYTAKLNELLKSGPSEFYERSVHLDKIKVATENKLQLLNERLGSLYAAMSKIRAEVDTMYIMREGFVNTWKKLTNELENISQKKNKTIEESLMALDEREKLLKKVRVVSAQNAKDRELLDTEVKERQRLNYFMHRLNSFTKTKSRSRYKHAALPSKREDPALQYEMQLDQIGEYEEAFNKLYELMGIDQISQIIQKFKSNEDEINRAVQYTNTNNADSSQLKDEIDHLEEEKLRTLEDMKSSREDFRRQVLRLDEEYCQANSQKLALSKTLHSTKRMLKLVLAAIKYLALLVHCTIDAEEDMESLTPYSVERVMTALEERIGSIYSIYRSLKNKPSEGRSREELPESHSGIQSDSAIGEEITISRSTEDLPSVGETFDVVSVDSGNISLPIDDVNLRKLMI